MDIAKLQYLAKQIIYSFSIDHKPTQQNEITFPCCDSLILFRSHKNGLRFDYFMKIEHKDETK